MPIALPTAVTGSRRWRRAVGRATWWLTGLVTLLALLAFTPAWLARLDLLAYDLLLPRSPAWTQSPVVIAIDDASLAELGRWPWPRARHAEMIDRLHEAGAAAVGLTVLFSEADANDPAGDAALSAAMARSARVVLPVAPAPGTLDPTRVEALSDNGDWLGDKAGVRLGHVDVELDLDGQARRLYLRAGVSRAELPALALGVRQLLDPSLTLESVPGRRAILPKTNAPGSWVRDHEVLLPGTQGLPTLSFASVLRDPRQLSVVRDRAVFVGVTATGLGGELVTPLSGSRSTMPAVVFHAHAYAALAQRTLMQGLSPWSSALLGLVLLGSLALWPRWDGRKALWALAHLSVPLLASAALLHATGLWFGPAASTLTLCVALLAMLGTRLQRARRQLLRSRQHVHATLQAIGDAVITLDARSRTIRFANPTVLAQAGIAQMVGLTLREAYPLESDSMDRLELAVNECLVQRRRVELPLQLFLDTQGGRSLGGSVSPLLGPDGQLDGAVIVLADQTDSMAAALELDHAATHDALTGLPNRVLLQQRLGLALARSQRHGNSAAILFLDLDRFKHINDSLGHRTGDEVLKVVARRLRQLCRDTDTVARWGGDEFVVVLEDLVDQGGAATAAAKVVEVLTQDVELGEAFGHVRLPSAGSVGVVMSPQDGVDMDELLAKADMAMYRAKAQPQACFHFWSDDINTSLHARLALEIDLRQGLRENLFVLHYQPQFALPGRGLVGMEALMRWQRTPERLLMPSDFIAVAESSGLIVDMGAWAMLEAARQVARWVAAGLQPVPVAVNVSARQCLNHDIVAVIRHALRETGIAPALLRLEITETTAMSDADQVIGLLRTIRTLGVGLALDDFGTGYSSLSHLRRFPVDEIKIDRSFVTDIATNRDDLAIVRATIALAHGLDLKVVAEGVESQAQAQLLEAEHCDVGQGHLYGLAQPVDKATLLLRGEPFALPIAATNHGEETCGDACA